MYILECSDGSYYTGSTNNLARRFIEHSTRVGANHTKKRLPVKLVYFEEYSRVEYAFYREKQLQGWSRKKKQALIFGDFVNCQNWLLLTGIKLASRTSASIPRTSASILRISVSILRISASILRIQ